MALDSARVKVSCFTCETIISVPLYAAWFGGGPPGRWQHGAERPGITARYDANSRGSAAAAGTRGEMAPHLDERGDCQAIAGIIRYSRSSLWDRLGRFQ